MKNFSEWMKNPENRLKYARWMLWFCYVVLLVLVFEVTAFAVAD